MYEELVSRLRNGLSCYGERCLSCPDKKHCTTKYQQEAADAIEKLSVYVQQLEELRKDGWYLQKTKMMTYGQAIMTRPLPEPPKEV